MIVLAFTAGPLNGLTFTWVGPQRPAQEFLHRGLNGSTARYVLQPGHQDLQPLGLAEGAVAILRYEYAGGS